MTFDFRRSLFVILASSFLTLAACSSPTPTAQQPSKPAEPEHSAAPAEPSKPAVEQPVNSGQQPRAAAVAAPKPKPQVREVPRQVAVANSPARPTARTPE